MDTPLASTLVMAFLIGGASGAIGSFILLRRMALVGDALSHVALPGIALMLAYQLDPFLGVLGSLVLAAIAIWWLESHSKLAPDALVGLLFTAALAIGILTIPDSEILESLFGVFPTLALPVLVGILLAAVAMIVFVLMFVRRFLFLIVSRDLAQVSAVSPRYDLALYLIFGVVVALGIKLVGTLLMGALTIIPAAIAKNISRSMVSYVLLAIGIGSLIATLGTVLAFNWQLLPGPVIILLGIGLFMMTLPFVRR